MTYHDSVNANEANPSSSTKRRTTRAVIILGVMVLPLLLTACGIPAAKKKAATTSTDTVVTYAPNSQIGRIQSRGNLIVGTRFDIAPFAYNDSQLGTPAGFDVDLAKSIAESIFGTQDIEGKINYVQLDPRNYELALEQNKVDMVIGRYAISIARKQFVDFAGPYFVSPQTVLVDTDNQGSSGSTTNISSLTDLNGKKVCVVTGSSDVDSLKAIAPGVDTTDVRTTISQCGADLLGGKVLAIAADHVDELSFLSNATNVKALAATYGNQPYGIGVKKGSDEFRSFLNDQIEAFKWSDAYTSDLADDSSKLKQPAVDRY